MILIILIIFAIGVWMFLRYQKVKTEVLLYSLTSLPLAAWLITYEDESPHKAKIMATQLVDRAIDLIFEKRGIPNLTLQELISVRMQMKSISPDHLIIETVKNIGPSMVDTFGDPPLGQTPSVYVFAIMLAGLFANQTKGYFDLKEIHQRILLDSSSS